MSEGLDPGRSAVSLSARLADAFGEGWRERATVRLESVSGTLAVRQGESLLVAATYASRAWL